VSEAHPSAVAGIELGTGPAEITPASVEVGLKPLDPGVAALCAPLSASDPCGPDLDLQGDADYLNFFACLESTLPISFFTNDGKPFEPSNPPEDQSPIDFEGQLAVIKRLFGRSRDIRLLLAQARLFILNRNLAGFATSMAAVGEWLNGSWDSVHPRPQAGELRARLMPFWALDGPTVTFSLQYVPLFETGRKEPVSYRGWLVANGEAKARPGDSQLSAATIAEALNEADAAQLAATRRDLALLKSALETIRQAFQLHGGSAAVEAISGSKAISAVSEISALVRKICEFIDPHIESATRETPLDEEAASGDVEARVESSAKSLARPIPATTADATEALAAIADYYSRSEPSSPVLPLVRQAYQLVGKSFLEIMTVLVPGQVDKAAFQIGTDQVFDLPVGKLSALSNVAAAASSGANGGAEPGEHGRPRYHVEFRSQAIALLDQVQQYFRRSEPSSPVPMLCQRARALAERDFMGVLRDVLPKAALKNISAEK
jgi:type VI secretion system protein ImpA